MQNETSAAGLTASGEVADPAVTDLSSNFGRHGWTVIGFQAVLFWFAAGLATHGLNITLPTLIARYGLDQATLLAWATPAAWAGVPAGFLAAKFAEKYGAKLTILIGIAACAVCWGLMGQASSVARFALCFAGLSFFATSFGYIAGPTLIATWFPLKKDLAFGWTTVGQALSSAFFVPLVAFFLAIFGPDYGFWGLSALLAVLFVAVALFIHNRPEEVGCHPDNDPRSLEKLAALKRAVPADAAELTTRRLLRDVDVWLIGLATGCVYIVLVGVISQQVPRLTALGLPMDTAISYVMITALIGIPGAYAWGWVGQKLGTKPALVVYMLWWLVAVALQMFEPKGAVLWASLLMIGFSLGGATNFATSIVASKFRREQFVKAFGVIHPIQSVVRCFSFSILAFGLNFLGGYAGAYALLAGVCLLTIVLVSRIDTRPIA
ncbi:MFS transporter [Pleomorphomonas carboxyditropha]|uniref:MFS transporter n=1 Tax=Pleomorphomonas carboxyditropha TaxID=2023338 RepID=A0A2G9X084_9HYPH|nr:MFS transporter [Pleomorphomonas carboxyditropha]PIP00335.1 MFS transporter [Pleomorphomonas carboxyditropha]